jgi:hypothetical protein
MVFTWSRENVLLYGSKTGRKDVRIEEADLPGGDRGKHLVPAFKPMLFSVSSPLSP